MLLRNFVLPTNQLNPFVHRCLITHCNKCNNNNFNNNNNYNNNNYHQVLLIFH